MSYKKNAGSNRDALFGGAASGGGPKYKTDAASNRDALFGGAAAAAAGGGGGKSRPAAAPRPATTTTTTTTTTTSRGYLNKKKNKTSAVPSLSAEARAVKLAEAEEYKKKANKCMERSFFSRPDPVAAGTYFKRAADAYQAAGESRSERLYRTESAKCNMSTGAWASAAADYSRAAELAAAAADLPAAADRRRESADLHKRAAEAWTQMNEKAKAAGCRVDAAVALFDSDEDDEEATVIPKEALQGMEEAVEAHVPDPLNKKARYRQTGRSAFLSEDGTETAERPSEQTLALAAEHVVTRSYAHEPVQKLIHLLATHREYASALYAAGAVSTILEREKLSSLSLSRAYCTETILTLAMGDSVAAEQDFLNRHVQSTPYLSSRECKLSEDLFTAVKRRDWDALEEARDPAGSNRAALANLDPALRATVAMLRISGVAKAQKKQETDSGAAPATRSSSSAAAAGGAAAPSVAEKASLQELVGMKTGYEKEAEDGANMDGDALQAELDGLDFGLDDDDEDGDDDDDDFDLR